MSELPLGQPESQVLEFKGAKALENAQSIVREVVGMLNSDTGGVIWVGLGEEDSVAVRVEAVENASSEVARLYNLFVDTIDPPPTGAEVRVLPHSQGPGEVLRIDVAGDSRRGPYAQLIKGARAYHLRVGERIRSLTSEELRTAFRNQQEDDRTEVSQKLAESRDQWIQSPQKCLYLELVPVRDLALEPAWQEVKELLITPSRTGNRRFGANFSAPHLEPAVAQGKWVMGRQGGPVTTITKAGVIEFQVPLAALADLGSDTEELEPIRLLEYPTSLLRLARVLNTMEGCGGPQDWVADMLITGLGGWKLRPYSPGSATWEFDLPPWQEQPSFKSDVFQLEKPILIRKEDLAETPDRCAYRLYCQVYEAFGWGGEMIPSEFDKKTGVLRLPE